MIDDEVSLPSIKTKHVQRQRNQKVIDRKGQYDHRSKLLNELDSLGNRSHQVGHEEEMPLVLYIQADRNIEPLEYDR